MSDPSKPMARRPGRRTEGLLAVAYVLIVSAGAAAAQDGAIEAPVARTLADWYALGGWIMHLLVACSVVTLGLALERLWATRRAAVVPTALLDALRTFGSEGASRDLRSKCLASPSAIARVVRAGIEHYGEGRASVRDAMESAGAREAALLRRNLVLIAALAGVAPMLGLLGTVLGMIEAFDMIARTGTGDARIVAGGIFEALVTTAAGLSVGIAALVCHTLIRKRAETRLLELDAAASEVLDRSHEASDEAHPTGGTDLAPAEA